MNLALIIARKGSKRIVDKNLKKIKNKYIIQIVLEKILNSKLFNKVIVSTDSLRIQKISNKIKKVETPFLRPKILSGDKVGTRDVVLHAINFFKKKKYHITNVCCFYPTSIFFTKTKLLEAFNKIDNKNYVISCSAVNQNLNRSFKIKNGKNKFLFKGSYFKRTQDFDEVYVDAAQFYLGKVSTWKNQNKIINSSTKLVKFSRFSYVDIDNLDDLSFAKKLFKF